MSKNNYPTQRPWYTHTRKLALLLLLTGACSQRAAAQTFDRSDAPATYGTPCNTVSPDLRMGALVDAEPASLPTALANGDDLNGSDDEDGVSSFPTIYGSVGLSYDGYTVNVSVYHNPAVVTAANTTVIVEGWIDWNNNGVFDGDEWSVTTVSPSASQQIVPLTWSFANGNVPTITGSQAQYGRTGTFARFRVSYDVGAKTTAVHSRSTFCGTSSEGEVEDYYIPFTGTPLSIGLKAFDAQLQGNAVQLNWATTGTAIDDRFEIERSTDGRNWSGIYTATAMDANMNASGEQSYSATDAAPYTGANYYRLRIIGSKGSHYSEIRRVDFALQRKNTVILSPNPANNQITISGLADGDVLRITNALGQQVLEARMHAAAYTADVSTLASGIYQLSIAPGAGGQQQVYRLNIVR